MAKKKNLPIWATTVTPFSRFLALLMLVILPILGFCWGTLYQSQIDSVKQPTKEFIIYKNSYTCTQPPDGTIICRTNADCPTNYTCNQAGPIQQGGPTHKTCWKNGHAVPL